MFLVVNGTWMDPPPATTTRQQGTYFIVDVPGNVCNLNFSIWNFNFLWDNFGTLLRKITFIQHILCVLLGRPVLTEPPPPSRYVPGITDTLEVVLVAAVCPSSYWWSPRGLVSLREFPSLARPTPSSVFLTPPDTSLLARRVIPTAEL